jgi:hypothetical protein
MLLVSCLPCLILPRTNPPPSPPRSPGWVGPPLHTVSYAQIRKRVWRSGRASESKSENLGSRLGDVAFETNQICRTSSTFVKVCRKSLIFLVKSSAGMSKTFFDTCVNWSCVTRCGANYFVNLFTVLLYFKMWRKPKSLHLSCQSVC